MPEESVVEYEDFYPTCAETYCTLRIFSDVLTPNEISSILGITPTSYFTKGEPFSKGRLYREANGWFYDTEKLSASRDARRHIDLLISLLRGKAKAFKQLVNQGCDVDIVNYWVSKGQGGPWLMPYQMVELGALGIPIWWDIFFFDDKDVE